VFTPSSLSSASSYRWKHFAAAGWSAGVEKRRAVVGVDDGGQSGRLPVYWIHAQNSTLTCECDVGCACAQKREQIKGCQGSSCPEQLRRSDELKTNPPCPSSCTFNWVRYSSHPAKAQISGVQDSRTTLSANTPARDLIGHRCSIIATPKQPCLLGSLVRSRQRDCRLHPNPLRQKLACACLQQQQQQQQQQKRTSHPQPPHLSNPPL